MIDRHHHPREASVPGFRGHPCPRRGGLIAAPLDPRLASFPRGGGRSDFEIDAMFRAARSLSKKQPERFRLNPEPRQNSYRV